MVDIAPGAKLYQLGTITLGSWLSIDPQARYGWAGGGAVMNVRRGPTEPYVNTPEEQGLPIPTASGASLNLNRIQLNPGYGDAHALAVRTQWIMDNDPRGLTRRTISGCSSAMTSAPHSADLRSRKHSIVCRSRMGNPSRLSTVIQTKLSHWYSSNAVQRAITELFTGTSTPTTIWEDARRPVECLERRAWSHRLLR